MAGVIFWLCVLFVFYAYLGYPLLVMLISRFYRPERTYPVSTPTVSLIIAAYNEESVIASKLENTLALDYPQDDLQIIVAADGSNDRTMEIVRTYKVRGVELSYESARRGKMSAINRAMKLVRNEIVVFSDANNFYEKDTLREIVKPYVEISVGAVTGSKSVLKEGTSLGEADGLYWHYESFVKRMENRIGCCVGVSGEIFSLRSSLFNPAPEKIINDDFYMALDVIQRGYRLVYAPGARSIEPMTSNELDEITRRTRIFAGHLQILFEAFWKLPLNRPLLVLMIFSHKYLRSFVPLGLIGALLTNLTALMPSQNHLETWGWVFLTEPSNWVFFSLQLLFYVTALVGMKIKSTGVVGKLLYLPVFLLNSNYAAWLGLVRYFSGRQTVIWKKAVR